MTIIIVLFFCFILYKAGKIAELLNLFRLAEPTPVNNAGVASPVEFEQEAETVTYNLDILDRLQAENKAIIIYKNKGFKDPLTLVKMLSDTELIETINNN